VVFPDIQLASQLRQNLCLLLIMFERPDSGDGFDTPYARSHRLLADNFQDADIADAVDVCPAAKLLGVKATGRPLVGNGDDANVAFRVFVAKESERAGG
jgi:hypothetical protein